MEIFLLLLENAINKMGKPADINLIAYRVLGKVRRNDYD